jgi:hypothetical protein
MSLSNLLSSQTSASLAAWLTLLWIVGHDLRGNRKESTAIMVYGAPSKTRPRFAWPWVLAGVVATAIAWGPLILTHFDILSSLQTLTPTKRPPIPPISQEQVKNLSRQVAMLKSARQMAVLREQSAQLSADIFLAISHEPTPDSSPYEFQQWTTTVYEKYKTDFGPRALNLVGQLRANNIKLDHPDSYYSNPSGPFEIRTIALEFDAIPQRFPTDHDTPESVH